MKRALLALVATVAGVLGIFNYNPNATSVELATADDVDGSVAVTAVDNAAASSVPARQSVTTTAPGQGATRTLKGDVTDNSYGDVQVVVEVSGNKIVKVDVPKYPTAGNSGTINSKAVPKLKAAALSAQSADVASVSGATYTSEAFKKSLQTALAQL